jgi:hypothetical protein
VCVTCIAIVLILVRVVVEPMKMKAAHRTSISIADALNGQEIVVSLEDGFQHVIGGEYLQCANIVPHEDSNPLCVALVNNITAAPTYENITYTVRYNTTANQNCSVRFDLYNPVISVAARTLVTNCPDQKIFEDTTKQCRKRMS